MEGETEMIKKLLVEILDTMNKIEVTIRIYMKTQLETTSKLLEHSLCFTDSTSSTSGEFLNSESLNQLHHLTIRSLYSLPPFSLECACLFQALFLTAQRNTPIFSLKSSPKRR